MSIVTFSLHIYKSQSLKLRESPGNAVEARAISGALRGFPEPSRRAAWVIKQPIENLHPDLVGDLVDPMGHG